MPETVKTKIPCYSMKMQIYPNAAQKEKIERIFRALQVAYNITFHEVFQKNEMVCTKPNENGDVWPDFYKMSGAAWKQYLVEQNSIVEEAPPSALNNSGGLFLRDAKSAWEKGMLKRPVNPNDRKNFHFYNSGKPRRSFMVQMSMSKIVPSEENGKVAWIEFSKDVGKIKARGFNRKLWFGKDGEHTFTEARKAKELSDRVIVRVSKDTCGDYFISVTFSDGTKHDKELYIETPAPKEEKQPTGIDVGIKDIAILSSGQKIENKHFKKEKDKQLKKMNRQLSERWGYANLAFRDYNSEIRSENKKNPDSPPKPLSQPSRRYMKTKENKARAERKIARQRETYYHQQTAAIIRQSSMIAVETLHVKNMMRNHKLAYALGDAAMSDFLAKLKYKAERFGVEIVPIGMFEPTSQKCSVCGEINQSVKNLSVREWICQSCGTRHDRDINAARNILAAAVEKGAVKDVEVKPEPDEKPKRSPSRARGRPDKYVISEENPDIIVSFSKELTTINNPRYIIKNKKTNEIIDDAQGAGFRSISNAKNCYKAKRKWSESH